MINNRSAFAGSRSTSRIFRTLWILTICFCWLVDGTGSVQPSESSSPKIDPATLAAKRINNPKAQLSALVRAAEKLKNIHGDWKIPWGDIHRLQRHSNVANLAFVPFSAKLPSVPTAGIPGSLGVAFTQYYTPPVPTIADRRKSYAVVASSYMGIFEFEKNQVPAKTLLQYGASSDPASPHFFDQAQLLSQGKFKESPFYWKDVVAQATRTYHPGEKH